MELSQITEILSQNQFLSGGAILGIGGMLINHLKSTPSDILHKLRNLFYFEFIVEDRESDLYSTVMKKCVIPTLLKKRTKEFRVSLGDEYENPELYFLAPRTTSFFAGFYKGYPYWISLEDPMAGADLESSRDLSIIQASKPNTIHLSFLCPSRKAAQSYFDSFVEEVKRDRKSEEELEIFRYEADGSSVYSNRSLRPISSLEYNFDANSIIEYCKTFISRNEWYIEKGIPWKTGLLLSGPPGNGKTNFVLALASELNIPIYTCPLEGVTTERFSRMVSTMRSKSILLIEDIDSFYKGRETLGDTKVSFSTLLNILDGVTSPSGVITILTTNHKENLDSALIRPGRIDRKIEIANATVDQIKRYFRKFYPNSTEEQANRFVSNIEDYKYNMATIQGHFIQHLEDPESACSDPILED